MTYYLLKIFPTMGSPYYHRPWNDSNGGPKLYETEANARRAWAYHGKHMRGATHAIVKVEVTPQLPG